MDTANTYRSDAVVIASQTGGELPSQIEIMPVGDVSLADKRGQVARVTDPAGLVSRSMLQAAANVVPIDFGHGMDGAADRDPRAAGWITAMTVEGDRIMANVEWTPGGEEAVRGKMFRFVSPTFTVDGSTKEVARILRVALTNNPALPELAKLASKQETEDMPQWLTDLAAKLGLPEDSDEATISAAAQVAVDQVGHMAPIVTAAGLTGDLTQAGASAIVTRLQAVAEPDPAQFVTKAAFDEVSTQLASLQGEVRGDQTARLVTAAMEDGKVTPATKGWATNYAAKDPEGFKTYLASAPVLVAGGSIVPDGEPAAQAGVLSTEERAVCAATGVSEEAFLATKQGKPSPKSNGEG